MQNREIEDGGASQTIKYSNTVKKIREDLIFSSELGILKKKDRESDYHVKKVQRRKLQGI